MAGIDLLSGGAAQALVRALQPQFREQSGYDIQGTFGAVGAMRATLGAGHPADLVILTAAIVAELAAVGTVLPATVADIGDVETAVAVREADATPAIEDERSLRDAFLAADAIYFPDPKLATAGIHVARVLDRLGIAAQVSGKLRSFPNGATAMAALAQAPEHNPIGCTQVTEIRATKGTRVAAALPAGFDLTTRYTGAVVATAVEGNAAGAFLRLLTSEAAGPTRRHAGFI